MAQGCNLCSDSVARMHVAVVGGSRSLLRRNGKVVGLVPVIVLHLWEGPRCTGCRHVRALRFKAKALDSCS